ncbi:hypothetical protein ACFV6G_35705 [Streptomyces lavendulae]|uniref:hypothetical protein n=1 Tax=Streptomyces lavendulae TaxID=1914 RepID=UPI0036C10819
MSTPLPQPQGPRTSRTPAVALIGGSAVVGALVMAGAPWWAVAVCAVAALLVPGIILFAQVVLPEDSAHKRDVLLALMRQRERRTRAAPVPRQKPRPSAPEVHTATERDRQLS